MSVYGRGTKNGQYIRGRNSYDSYQGNSCSKPCNPLDHSFDHMIETARNKVICEDKRKEHYSEEEMVTIDNKYLNMNTSILMSIIISIISISNLWMIIKNFVPNIFIFSSFIFNSILVLVFLSKLCADSMMKNSIFYHQYKSNKEFIFVSICLFSALFNSYFVLS